MLRLRTSLRVMSATRLILRAITRPPSATRTMRYHLTRRRRIRHRRQWMRHLTIKRLSTTLRQADATLTKVDALNRNALNRNALSLNALILRITTHRAATNRAMRNRARPATSRSPERTVLVDRPVGRT